MSSGQLITTMDRTNAPAGVSLHFLGADLHVSRDAITLAGVLFVGAVLRFALLGRYSVWFDEAVVGIVAQAKWPDILPLLRANDQHPPLYYLVMKVWVGLAGTGDAALRFPSACFSLASVGLTYALLRHVTPGPVSLTGALLVSTAPFEIWSAQTARMYPLLGALALGATLALVRGVRYQRWRSWGVYPLLAAAMVYTDYLGFLVLAAHGLWVVCYQRRHFARWAAAMVAVGVLYAPWVPSFWHQATRAPFLSQLYGDTPAYLRLGGLFGLLAFGGSVFGMPSYFYSSTPLTPLQQLLILLPFLIVLGFGIASLARDRSALALLGLPFAVTVGGMQLVALVNNAFIARWFSFLYPFYAAFIAEGIFALPRAIRLHRDRTAAFLTAGILLVNVGGLDRYYLDPALHPFQWRGAATTIARDIRPADLLLFGNRGDELAFAHYFKRPAWTMELLPRPDFSALQALAARHHRVWLIIAPLPADNALLTQTLSSLNTSFVMAERIPARTDAYPQVYLFEAKPSPR